MNYYIKMWPENTATVFDEKGNVIWVFASMEEATLACMEANQCLDQCDRIDV
ncbi:hypothetical protein ACFL17_09640 [Pseudomonadota bacterium]